MFLDKPESPATIEGKAYDYLGNEIAAGDIVIYMLPNYREFRKGTIAKVTGCYIFLTNTLKQLHSQVILFKKEGK